MLDLGIGINLSATLGHPERCLQRTMTRSLKRRIGCVGTV